MTIHILGIYNFIKLGNNNNIKKLSLINCIWDCPSISQYKKEVEEYLHMMSALVEIGEETA